MRIVISPDSFKGSLSSAEISDALESCIRENLKCADLHFEKLAASDGGEGAMDALKGFLCMEEKFAAAQDCLGKSIYAPYAFGSGRALIELAKTSGLTLIDKGKRDIMRANTYGTGMQIRAAIGAGARKVSICAGGSATNDGAMGALAALGFAFLDKNNKEITSFGPENLGKVCTLCADRVDGEILSADFELLCDVRCPLLGPNGAARLFSAQKGASKSDTEMLESGMEAYCAAMSRFFLSNRPGHYGEYLNRCGKIRDLNPADFEGAGAAGGFAFGLVCALGAKIRSGAAAVLEAQKFAEKCSNADIMITAEGKADFQSLQGKLPVEAAKLAREANSKISTVLFCGRLDESAKEKLSEYFNFIFEAAPKYMPDKAAMGKGQALLNLKGAAKRACLAGAFNTPSKT